MGRPTIALRAAVIAGLLVVGCNSPTPGPRRSPAPPQPETGRTDAFKAVEDLEAAVDEAREAVRAASKTSSAATEEQRIRLSDVRRGVVAANVALQKAREALGRDDYGAARQATLGVAEHLRGLVEKLER